MLEPQKKTKNAGCIEPIRNSGNGPKTTSQFFLHWANFDRQRQSLFNRITSIDDAMFAENKNSTVYIVISKTKMKILMSILMGIVLSTQRFNASCFYARTTKKKKKKTPDKILRNQNC